MMMAGTVLEVNTALHKSRSALTINVLLDAFVRQDAATINVDLITDSHIIPKHGDVLQSGPATDSAVPADDRALDPSMVLDLGVLQ